MPAAARVTDPHTCPKVEPGPKPHVGGPVTAGEGTVLIGHQKAARIGDALSCQGPSDAVASGEATVLIGNRHPARVGDGTTHGGVIVGGCPSVLIGSDPQVAALATEQPFVENCDDLLPDEEAPAEG